MSGAGRGFLARVVPHGTVWLFADETKTISEAAAPFDWGKVQDVDIHSVWILNWT